MKTAVSRAPGDRVVTPLELFFDLVYVFAIGQLSHHLIVLAVIGIAVGDELAIAHPGDDATFGFTLLAFGGPALVLLAQSFFLHRALGYVPRSRPLGLAALAILAIATAPLTLLTARVAAICGELNPARTPREPACSFSHPYAM